MMNCLTRFYYLICAFLLLFLFSLSYAELCSPDQSSALLQFKQLFSFTNGSSFNCEYFPDQPVCQGACPSSPKIKSWKKDTDCCLWDGITCDNVTGHVIGLDLSCNWLLGNIPSNSSLFLLSHLQSLNLAFNDFNYSQVSSSFNCFPNLTHLNLSNSNFFDQVPSEISHLSKLVSLDLSYNYLIIKTPALKGIVHNLTNIREFIFDQVDLSTISPRSLSNLSSSLTSLSLGSCFLIGRFPDNIFHQPNLQKLNLGFNSNLTGIFPKSNWSSPLSFVNVSFTNFQGELSNNAISSLKFLNTLDLYYCHFNGSIPASLGNLTKLVYLDLAYNHFTGSIPSSLSNLVQLRHLTFRDNSLTGEIPDIFFNLTQLSLFEGSFNLLSGPIPTDVSRLKSLVTLTLSSNLLNGTIPSGLYTLPLLKNIDLSCNHLIGNIKNFQNSLRVIQLNNNGLNGSIPNSIFELENLTDLVLCSNNLSGALELYMFTKLKNLQILNLSHNNLSLSTTYKVNSSFPNLYWLGLSCCNMRELPYILRNHNQLMILELSENKIHGDLPIWLWELGMENLTFLNLSHNSLEGLGQFPSVGQLPWKLQYLDVSSNSIEGSFPIPPLGTTVFLISNNNLSGEIPQSICDTNTIEVLDLSYNNLSGRIPECMGNFSINLQVLDLRKNKFYGKIPGTFTEGSNLRTLNLNNNGLEGPVPRSLINCAMLEVLDLGNNKINDIFPFWLKSLTNLQVLVLRSNYFHGSVWHSSDHDNSYFPMLRIFDLSSNRFSGSLPTRYFENLNAMMINGESAKKLKYMGGLYYLDSVEVVMKGRDMLLVKIMTSFTSIDFSHNYFDGEIPIVIGELQGLRLLNLSQNSLGGHIPSSLGNLILLESLDLSSNKLSGQIPSQLVGLTFLSKLNLSQNQLVGLIPQGNQFNTFSSDSYNGNLGLCGPPLTKKCEEPTSSTFHDDEDHNMSNWFDWKVIMMGYGCGLLLGLLIGYAVFSTGKPQWFLRIIEKRTLGKSH
ncbi:receptor-like protein 7 [Mangifera indica]|uniref:receptor-like protein 7 n=1 Tax=Mangifera indica TaxID=29780 RepID=UPI001CFBBD6F|nr:receptor-like protein 7 [Mangifera indica]